MKCYQRKKSYYCVCGRTESHAGKHRCAECPQEWTNRLKRGRKRRG